MSRIPLAPALVALAVCGLACTGPGWAAACGTSLPATQAPASPTSPVTADELVGLRDIGPLPFADPETPLLTLSPDGSRVAFQLRQADPVGDTYCLQMMVMDARAGARPRIVDAGGEVIRITQDMAGVTGVPSGFRDVVTPYWSPDGTYIAFLRRDGGVTQAWIASADGKMSRAVTHGNWDVEAVAWTHDGRGLVVSGRPGLAAARETLRTEGWSGYLFDDRYVPFAANTPFPRNDIARETFAADLESGTLRRATEEEVALLSPRRAAGVPEQALLAKAGPAGQVAWTDLSDPANVVSATVLHVTSPGGAWTCMDERCKRAAGIWWADDDTVVFERREGWARSETGLYAWRFRSGQVRQIVKTEDVLVGCQPGNGVLVCAHEASMQPREIVSIQLTDGKVTSLFDPNPAFKGRQLGSVQRLHFSNSFGVEGFGDLVLPPGHQPGQVHPLVVVQYESRGFLRGGTGDDFPILLFAANGIAVLRFEDLLSPGYNRGGASWQAINSYDLTDWRAHRSTEELLENGVKLAIASGSVDARRLGITGLSAGSNNARWALLNSHLFAAAAVGSCCEDTTSIMTTFGEGNVREMRAMGYPGLTDDGTAFWAPLSLRLNARHMKTPLLMQLADNEYLVALESYTALKEQNAPVEMYVFPDEFHEKWHPAHRRAIYTRAVDWFRFWLDDAEDPDPAKHQQYQRWRLLRANASGSGAASGH